jgi:hypothetical protein
MKNQYITPAIRVVRLENRSCLLNYSVNNYQEINMRIGDMEN